MHDCSNVFVNGQHNCKISYVSGDIREVSFLFQSLSIIIQRFNTTLFRDTFILHDDPDLQPFQLLSLAFFYCF